MNNLHRELAPISDAAWAEIEDEARRTFTRHVAGRRVVDVIGPGGVDRRGRHRPPARSRLPATASLARVRESQPVVELRVPFSVDRRRWTTSSAARRTRTGSRSRTPPSRSRSPRTARSSRARRRGITGIRAAAPTRRSRCPTDPGDYPDAVAPGADRAAPGRCRRPVHAAAVSADAYTAVGETTDTATRSATHRPARRRRDHLGAGPRRRVPAVDPRRRLRAAPGQGPVDRLPVPRCGQRAALPPGVADVPRPTPPRRRSRSARSQQLWNKSSRMGLHGQSTTKLLLRRPLLTRMSTAPASVASRRTSSASLRSAAMKRALPPAFSISLTVSAPRCELRPC